jgi:hypothetical protein
MWDDTVFVSRQKEIRELSTNFAQLLDGMVVDHPLAMDPKLLEEVSEEEEVIEPPRDPAFNIAEAALLLLHEIDQMRKETYQLILWFRPHAKSRSRLASLQAGIQDLYAFLDSLRVRAERLLSL